MTVAVERFLERGDEHAGHPRFQAAQRATGAGGAAARTDRRGGATEALGQLGQAADRIEHPHPLATPMT